MLVIGAGALGNEILKNLALLGIGQVFVADLDSIENSNLSRCVLFRAEDEGRRKCDVAAGRASEIYPDMKIQPFFGNVVYDLGLGVFRWADVILCGLDNREARVAINRAAARAGKVWIDGAIERLDGVARVFDPACGPCYECTMSEVDWKMLEARRSCALLSRDEMNQGKVPTTPTTASIIAGIQCQEAVKLLHGLDVLSGQGFVFDGSNHQSYVVDYTQRSECPSHDPYQPIVRESWSVSDITASDMLQRVRRDLGPTAVVEFNNDLLESLRCPECENEEMMFSSLGCVNERKGRCTSCGADRIPQTFHTLNGQEKFLDRTLKDLGVPEWDIIGGRSGLEQKYYEFGGDQDSVLGPLGGTDHSR
ncbi:putative adenylyltransferase/sulfurtransferase MoeZ [Symmachiella macrocystis]|uniref:Putative adenylyltransferase/sulfurtransferase MoeZ n=1 Tax=Symmachiella macrocystis TaxID=2527985 RepID=A0A5C6AXF8_9PLAN|nr:putative adenylyltransferase/sulfurtransferase MoeZ [Symmachiella macrocystis]